MAATESQSLPFTVEDYNAELDSFTQKLSHNQKTFQKILSTQEKEIALLCEQHLDQVTKTTGIPSLPFCCLINLRYFVGLMNFRYFVRVTVTNF